MCVSAFKTKKIKKISKTYVLLKYDLIKGHEL